MSQEEEQTKLPDINNHKGGVDGFVGPVKASSKEGQRNPGPLSGGTGTMSRHSSRKSVPITNNFRSTNQMIKPNRTLKDSKN